jgi:lysophospholipase L1-like esterase
MIVCIGDSITAGQHLEDPDQPWPSLLDGYVVRAAGVPGDTTRLGLERFPRDVQVFPASKVIIQFGHNDCNRWETDRGLPRVSILAFRANLIEMVDRCRIFGAAPLLCTLTPSRRSEQHAEDVARYDRIIRSVAEAEDVRLVDVRPKVQAPEHFMTDGLHLSPEGHRAYAEIVLAALR